MQENNANEILKKEVNEAKTELNEMKKAKEQEKKSRTGISFRAGSKRD